MNSLLVRLVDARDVSMYGGKAVNLGQLLRLKLPVPDGFAISVGAFDAPGNLSDRAAREIEKILDAKKTYAVRSSALSEDAEGASWAGQFESFLYVDSKDVLRKVLDCHNSAKARAHAYAEQQGEGTAFNVAVVVQEMIDPTYAGVLFTQDPLTGDDVFVTEYVEGVGESLVSGQADPVKVQWPAADPPDAPFDIKKLDDLAKKIKRNFTTPQDVEWAWDGRDIWLVQTRPITAVQTSGEGYYLGEPEDLFYWGPSRAKPIYMSDFMSAAEQFFIGMSTDPKMPNPPKTLVLFHEGKMVWLSNVNDFVRFTEETFDVYEQRDKLEEDIKSWRSVADSLDKLAGEDFDACLLKAWGHTLFAEFSLYGAESSLAKRLKRFDAETSQKIWGAFTVPDKPTFLNQIDEELRLSGDAGKLAEIYPWIQDGYDGTSDAGSYFAERLKIVVAEVHTKAGRTDRESLAKELGLTAHELHALKLARELAQFMDDRKAWMMQTRHLIKRPLGEIEHGWIFDDGQVRLIEKSGAAELWERYVDFRASTNAVKGIVASNAGRHFINGKVVVVSSPTDNAPNDRILVVPSTSPSYVPLMRTARALITDHGGMMSHAAIVAREFGLPCIVGTKQATKVLETGDKVVLDLVRGEVNK